MTDTLFNYLSSKFPITFEEFEMINKASILKRIAKKRFLLQEGDIWRYQVFVVSGLLRTYSIDSKGLEHITNFSSNSLFLGDMESYLSEYPSKLNIDALEDSQVLLIPKQDFEHLQKVIPSMDAYLKKTIAVFYIESQNRILSNISLPAEKRYYNFITNYSNIVKKMPQHMIASYLGISAETLSRVRSKNGLRQIPIVQNHF